MERITLTNSNIEEAAARAAEVLGAGGVVLYPTDTLYGLGADALSDEAVAKIYAVKGRDEKKPIHAIVADLETAARYAVIDGRVRTLIARFGGAVTPVCAKKEDVASGIAQSIATFGFRVPDNSFCIALARAFDGPVTATSANAAGEMPERSVGAILAQLCGRTPDLVVDAGELPQREPSTVVDLSTETANILRKGAISTSDIMAALGSATV